MGMMVKILYHGMKAMSAYVTVSPTRYFVPVFLRCASMTPVTRLASFSKRSMTLGATGWGC
jgi:hypothetical protein